MGIRRNRMITPTNTNLPPSNVYQVTNIPSVGKRPTLLNPCRLVQPAAILAPRMIQNLPMNTLHGYIERDRISDRSE